MALPDHIAAMTETLDPAGRAVVALIWHIHEEQTAQLDLLRKELAARDAALEKYRRMLFGSRSEKMPPIATEVRRAVEPEDLKLDVPAGASDAEVDALKATARRVAGRAASTATREKRKRDLSRLPVVHEEVLVAPDQLPAGKTLDDYRQLGDGEVVHRIEHVREHLVMVKYRLQKLVERGGDRIIQAPSPANVVDGGLWGPSVYAQVVVDKCVDSMPLYRQSAAFARGSVGVARSVLCGLYHRAADVVEPLYKRLIELVTHAPYVHADETRLRVAEARKARDAWVWALVSKDVVAYVFSATRGGATAESLLKGTLGHLIADGYSGYNGSVGENRRTRVGCWAHARRYFWEALKTAPSEARRALDAIVELYRVEHEAAAAGVLGDERHRLMRDARSREVVSELLAWTRELGATIAPRSPLGQAIGYLQKQSKALTAFLEDPAVPLDNNVAERALRVVAIGRKNFLFVGHDEGGRNLAMLQTICHTCLLHGVNPYEYLKDVLVRVRTHPAARIDELLPMNWLATVRQ